MKWETIDSAPRDETEVIVSGFEEDQKTRWVTVACFRNGRWEDEYFQPFLPPTHWMPLPDPPVDLV